MLHNCRKFPVTCLSWCRHHIFLTNIIVVGIEIVSAIAIWFFGDGEETFQQVNNYAFLCASVVIASVAAMNSIFASMAANDSLTTTSAALDLTKESLELTRKTTTPFLIISDLFFVPSKLCSTMEIEFVTKNTGSLPANSVSVEFSLLILDDGDERLLQHVNLISGAMYFPLAEEHYNIEPQPKIREEIYNGKTKVKIVIRYQHMLTREFFETILRYKILRTKDSRYIFRPLKSDWRTISSSI